MTEQEKAKIYLVMLYNYPYAIFKNSADAVNFCKEYVFKFGSSPMAVDEYELNGRKTKDNMIWANWWREKKDD